MFPRHGCVAEMSRDHMPCCTRDRKHIQGLGGHVDDVYFNVELNVTMILCDWHTRYERYYCWW